MKRKYVVFPAMAVAMLVFGATLAGCNNQAGIAVSFRNQSSHTVRVAMTGMGWSPSNFTVAAGATELSRNATATGMVTVHAVVSVDGHINPPIRASWDARTHTFTITNL